MKTLTLILLAILLSLAGLAQTKCDTAKRTVLTPDTTLRYYFDHMPMLTMPYFIDNMPTPFVIDPHFRDDMPMYGTNTILFSPNPATIFKISMPSKDGTVTVTIYKSRVHFINDSTFTYKTK